MDHTDSRTGVDALPSSTSNWTINVSDMRTVKVSNVSLAASEKDIKEFFSFSGDIQYVEMQRETETSQLVYVTFKDSQGADTAMLLTGSTIADRSISIAAAEKYQLNPDAPPTTPATKTTATSSAVKKTENMVSTMLAKGFILGKYTLNKAKAFDELHNLSSNASATVVSIDRTIGLSEKLSIGTAVVNEKVRDMDERYQVSEITKSALAAAEQKASTAGAAIMSNPIVSSGASWLTSAIGAVAKAAEDVSSMTKEKVEKAEEEKKETLYKERTATVDDFTHGDRSSVGEIQIVSASSADNDKFAIV